MRFFDIFKPTTSTIEFGQRVFNLVYRVVFTTVVIVILGTLAIGVGYAANLGAQISGASENVQQFVRDGSIVLYLLTVIVSWLFAAADHIRLTILSFFSRRPRDDNPDHHI